MEYSTRARYLWMFGFAVTIAGIFALTEVTGQTLQDYVISGEAANRALTDLEISADTAVKITEHCVDYARERDAGVSVVILGPFGNIVHAHRMDGQTAVNIQTAQWKAETALYLRAPTSVSAARFDWQRQITINRKLDLFLNTGGLPIIVDNRLIGAIGVGGWGGHDEECGNAALEAVLGPQSRLDGAEE